MGPLKTIHAISRSTYRDIVGKPFYYVILSLLAGIIVFSKFITLFTFHQETNMVREMGIASITFFGFLVTLVLSGTLVTRELENLTAVTILSKPISRASYLLGKFFGLVLAIAPGILILAGVLILTLWWMTAPAVFGSDATLWKLGHPPGNVDPLPVMMRGGTLAGEISGCLQVEWKHALQANGVLVLQGALLSFLQGAILAAVCISLSAFFPVLVSTSATVALFLLGNLSGYMTASVDAWNIALLSHLAAVFTHLLPNLGYFNLQTYFSEGRIISSQYLGLALLYAFLYCFAVFLLSCTAFRRREIR